MKILFTSGTMQGGGAERVVSILSNYFISKRIEVDILVVRGRSIYPLDQNVKIIPIFTEAEFKNNLCNKIYRRLVFYQRIFQLIIKIKPQLIIPVHGGGWNAKFVLISKLLKIKVVASEHISHSYKKSNFFYYFERHFLYRLADAVTVLTKRDYQYYNKFLRRVYHLPNPLKSKDLSSFNSHENQVILAAGRLDSWHIKGFDMLLFAFSLIANKFPKWTLRIAGGGDIGLSYLKSLANTLNIVNQVQFIGFRSDLDVFMREASIFVLSSRIEGFGMVLLEAMAQGCACVSFDCDFGPAELLTHEKSGLIVPSQNCEEMASSIERLILNKSMREELGKNAILAAQSYSTDVIGEKWFRIFRDLGFDC